MFNGRISYKALWLRRLRFSGYLFVAVILILLAWMMMLPPGEMRGVYIRSLDFAFIALDGWGHIVTSCPGCYDWGFAFHGLTGWNAAPLARPWTVTAKAPLLPFFCLILLIATRPWYAWRRRLMRARLGLCPNCAYPAKSVDQQRCAECGALLAGVKRSVEEGRRV